MSPTPKKAFFLPQLIRRQGLRRNPTDGLRTCVRCPRSGRMGDIHFLRAPLRFLGSPGGLMSAVGSSLRTHCLAPSRVRAPIDVPIGATGYGRMFPELPSFDADESFLRALGRAGGVCDCGDTADDASSLSSVPAGWPFFGQYIAHDITADRSALTRHADPHALRNA